MALDGGAGPGSGSLGGTLHRLRVAACLTQQALAERAGISADAVAALERGRRQHPRPDTIDPLARALSLDEHNRAELAALAIQDAARARSRAPRPAARDRRWRCAHHPARTARTAGGAGP